MLGIHISMTYLRNRAHFKFLNLVDNDVSAQMWQDGRQLNLKLRQA